MINSAGLLMTALLFGGMALFSMGFAAFLFSALPASVAGSTLRRAFPHFYLFVLITSAVAAALLWSHNSVAAMLLTTIALTTLPARQILMPAINDATDSGAKVRFKALHSLSVVISLAHIGGSGFVLTRFA